MYDYILINVKICKINILYFVKEIEKVNKELFKNTFKFDEINNLIINSHKAIRIVRISNKREIILVINDKNYNLALEITVFSSVKIKFYGCNNS